MLYFTVVPLLNHFLQAGQENVNYNYWFRVPTAYKSVFLKEDTTLLNRRNYMLQVFAGCFHADAQHLGSPTYISSTVYDFFRGVEQMAD